MNRLRVLGLALVAVFAMGAVAAVSSASAATLPAFARCVKVPAGTGEFEKSTCEGVAGTKEWLKVFVVGTSLSATEECAETVKAGAGAFENSTCTTVGTGTKSFVRVLKGKAKFESKEGPGFLEKANKEKVECKADKNAGELTGPQTDKVTVTFTGCTALKGAVTCQNTATAGEIVTRPLVSKLGYISMAPVEVGLSLAPEGGGLFVTFECGKKPLSEVVEVGEKAGSGSGDSIIGKMTPINSVMTKAFELNFECTAVAGEQKIQKFVGGLTDVLESKKGAGAWEKSCESSLRDEVTLEEAGTIIA